MAFGDVEGCVTVFGVLFRHFFWQNTFIEVRMPTSRLLIPLAYPSRYSFSVLMIIQLTLKHQPKNLTDGHEQ